ncbi:hypothetical protein KDX38_13355 [Pseudomonas sp. CDFA 602]|uniref:hypothetical protein n=1 Tax=Pseudomonas californiensis TaxID=2829823 RepID=UPI001E399688|nr:hypothetical protein [Pseudomonas californiensis]MCD5994440.1 hypothetical protein [Pseudomonas californiensis]MCD6000198.1 hypothetical protein [Pseudomonas californiensis]
MLLNSRALAALKFAREYAERRKNGKGRVLETPFIFPPSRNADYVKQTSDLHKQWVPALTALNILRHPPCHCGLSYATMRANVWHEFSHSYPGNAAMTV